MDEPRWLTEGELRDWRSLAVLVQLLPGALERPLQREAGLAYFEYMVLAMLSEAPGRALRMSRLAELTAATLSRLSHVVTRLEKRGWTRRVPCPGDRRATIAQLTDAGHAKVVEAAPVHVAAVRALVLDPLSPADLTRLGALARTLLAHLDPSALAWAAPDEQ